MDIEQIVCRLIGEVDPIAETNEDNYRYENLKQMCDLIDDLFSLVKDVEKDHCGAPEYSRKRAAEHADKYLKSLKSELEEYGY